MVGGGSRKDEGSFTINSSNVFAALDTLRKKKKGDKKTKSSSKVPVKEPEPQLLLSTIKLNSKSWADVDDDDDYDYFANTAVMSATEPKPSREVPAVVECLNVCGYNRDTTTFLDGCTLLHPL
ncbi:hypothetical protein Dimus_019323 [Dionaea muscipula]